MIYNTTKILWLSDIHISKQKYNGAINNGRPKGKYNLFKKPFGGSKAIDFGEVLDSYFNAFLAKIKSEAIDYILISGDIAFSGLEEDYNYFNQLFLEKIKNYPNLENAKILFVPGNHDIDRANAADSLGLPLNAKGTRVDYKAKDKMLSPGRIEDLKKCFSAYSSFSTLYIKNIVEKDRCNNYGDHGLYGWVKDDSKKLLFVLINSSWFSLGTEINRLLVDKFKRDWCIRKYFFPKAFAKKLLDVKDSVSEYGSQMIGQMLIEDMKLQEVFDSYPDYTTILVAHHPPNWYSWQERYSKDQQLQIEMPLFHLIKNANFFLSGHEHVLKEAMGESYFDGTDVFHLKAGCFIEELNKCKGKDDFFSLTHQRFSILEIVSGRDSFLRERVFYYKPDEYPDKNYKHNWLEYTVNPIVFASRRVIKPNSENIDGFDVHKFIRTRYGLSGDIVTISDLASDDGNFFEFSIKDGQENQKQHLFYVLKKSIDSYKDSIETIVKSLVDVDQKIKKNVYFILQDIHIRPTLMDNGDYNGTNAHNNQKSVHEIYEKQNEIFYQFIDNVSMEMDMLRNKIFASFDSSSKSVEQINNLSLIIDILPFFEFQYFVIRL